MKMRQAVNRGFERFFIWIQRSKNGQRWNENVIRRWFEKSNLLTHFAVVKKIKFLKSNVEVRNNFKLKNLIKIINSHVTQKNESFSIKF